MAREFPRASPGNPLVIPADAWNAAMDVAEWFRQGRQKTGDSPQYAPRENGIVLVHNNTGEAIARFTAIALDHPGNYDANYPDRFLYAPYWESTEQKPRDPEDRGKFAIAQQPIPVDGNGLAMIHGITPARVLVDNRTKYFRNADVLADAVTLQPTNFGSAQLLWVTPMDVLDPASEKWGVVRLGNEYPAVIPFELKDDIAANGSGEAYPMLPYLDDADTEADTFTVCDRVVNVNARGRDSMQSQFGGSAHGARGFAMQFDTLLSPLGQRNIAIIACDRVSRLCSAVARDTIILGVGGRADTLRPLDGGQSPTLGTGSTVGWGDSTGAVVYAGDAIVIAGGLAGGGWTLVHSPHR